MTGGKECIALLRFQISCCVTGSFETKMSLTIDFATWQVCATIHTRASPSLLMQEELSACLQNSTNAKALYEALHGELRPSAEGDEGRGRGSRGRRGRRRLWQHPAPRRRRRPWLAVVGLGQWVIKVFLCRNASFLASSSCASGRRRVSTILVRGKRMIQGVWREISFLCLVILGPKNCYVVEGVPPCQTEAF